MAVSYTLTASCCSTTSLPHSSKPSGLTLFRTSIVEVWKVHVRVHELADERHQCSANEHLQQGVHSIRSPRIGKAGNVIPQLPGMPAATDNAQTVLRIAITFTDRLLIHISSRSLACAPCSALINAENPCHSPMTGCTLERTRYCCPGTRKLIDALQENPPIKGPIARISEETAIPAPLTAPTASAGPAALICREGNTHV